MLTEPLNYTEPTAVAITRLVCLTVVVLTVLVGGGVLLVVYPQHASVAFALIGVVIGASFGLASVRRPRRDKA